ncbi:MAG: hypothetical protein R3F62_17090 [Planctomycetota bacterium]
MKLDEEAWVSCWRCQARHHDPCWDEATRCAACGCERALGARRRHSPAVRHGLTAAALVLGIIGTLPLVLALVTRLQVGPPDSWSGEVAAAALAFLAIGGVLAIRRVLRDPDA